MQDIFITGTWRKEWNADFLPRLEQVLVEEGFSCFLPMRDSDQTGTEKNIFLKDIEGIDQACLVLAVGANNAQSANWGLEIGYAYAHKKPVVILTDAKSPPGLMTSGAASEVFVPEDINDIQSYIKDLASLIRRHIG